LIEYAPRARGQVIALRRHYESLDRPAALRGLVTALDQAERQIASNPAAGLPAPRPYPRLARPGVAWIKAGRYWISYTTTPSPVIVGVFYEIANIPRRV
jgi:plasmid stabilization system protein ParE